MSDADRLAAVLLRVVAIGLILQGILGLAAQLFVVVGASGDTSQLARFWFVLLGPLLYVIPGMLLYGFSRPLGIRLGRGLN